MFGNIYKQRVNKWEEIVTESILDSFQNNGWENVYFNQINESDYEKSIQIIKLADVFTMARKMIRKSKVNKPIYTTQILTQKTETHIRIYDTRKKKECSFKVSNENDLIFLKERDDKEVAVEKILKNTAPPKPNKDTDPLRSWCQDFLKEYSTNGSVNDSLNHVPAYKPTQSQITKLQKKREKELLQWGSQF